MRVPPSSSVDCRALLLDSMDEVVVVDEVSSLRVALRRGGSVS